MDNNQICASSHLSMFLKGVLMFSIHSLFPTIYEIYLEMAPRLLHTLYCPLCGLTLCPFSWLCYCSILIGPSFSSDALCLSLFLNSGPFVCLFIHPLAAERAVSSRHSLALISGELERADVQLCR